MIENEKEIKSQEENGLVGRAILGVLVVLFVGLIAPSLVRNVEILYFWLMGCC